MARFEKHIQSRLAWITPAWALNMPGSKTRAARSTCQSMTMKPWPRFHTCCRTEGIIPALETSHALAYAAKVAPSLPKETVILVNLSGRGDKDVATAARWFGLDPINESAEGR